MKWSFIPFNTQEIIGSYKSCQNQFIEFSFVNLFTYIKLTLEDKQIRLINDLFTDTYWIFLRKVW